MDPPIASLYSYGIPIGIGTDLKATTTAAVSITGNGLPLPTIQKAVPDGSRALLVPDDLSDGLSTAAGPALETARRETSRPYQIACRYYLAGTASAFTHSFRHARSAMQVSRPLTTAHP
jgi:hypothetical protein